MYVSVIRVVRHTKLDITLLSPGTLPVGQNSPQKVKYDLYAEGVGIRSERCMFCD